MDRIEKGRTIIVVVIVFGVLLAIWIHLQYTRLSLPVHVQYRYTLHVSLMFHVALPSRIDSTVPLLSSGCLSTHSLSSRVVERLLYD